jgi:hypothetical protein
MATSIFNYLRLGSRHFSYGITAFWLRFHGILVTQRWVNPFAPKMIAEAPVVPCTRPCRKKPVAGGRKLWKRGSTSITALPASQAEKGPIAKSRRSLSPGLIKVPSHRTTRSTQRWSTVSLCGLLYFPPQRPISQEINNCDERLLEAAWIDLPARLRIESGPDVRLKFRLRREIQFNPKLALV